ncbi:hypothetical protein [Pleurocapsa sp. FMAR1]|uniref:hypothetical protein n=1 Tax=Pleurocapsa sp. FMAR1 TaxID=3040204 RepID=UPI0029C65698|nr:hypothetical protein [Pleurocapsa sp. FMAR1]
MLERIMLAAVITCCIYLFLNLGGKSSKTPSFDAQKETVPTFLHRVAFLNP